MKTIYVRYGYQPVLCKANFEFEFEWKCNIAPLRHIKAQIEYNNIMAQVPLVGVRSTLFRQSIYMPIRDNRWRLYCPVLHIAN